MKLPDPPYLELNFYQANQPEKDAFARLIRSLIELGATFTGQAHVHHGVGISDQPFASITDKALELVSIADVRSLEQRLADPNIRVMQVFMEGATGTVHDVVEIVTYESISVEAARTDRHPLAIQTDGSIFSGELHHERAQEALVRGSQIYERFRVLVTALQPAYAAITSEYGLECPADLRRDPRSYAFRDFFVSGNYLGIPTLMRVKTLFANAYIEPLADGLYISCTKEFNPVRKALDTTPALKQSGEVAKFIAGIGK